jgi:hypothetical protein
MSNSSLAGWIVAGLLLGVVYANWVTMSHLPGSPRGAELNQAAQQHEQQTGDPPPTGQARQGQQYYADCSSPQSREDADLCEQRRMAKAAEDTLALAASQWWWNVAQAGATVAAALAAAWAAWAASVAANAASKTLIADQRAWMITELHIDEHFYIKKGVASIGIFMRNRNVGRTPALDVFTSVEMVSDHDRVAGALARICAQDRRGNPRGSRLVAPGEQYDRPWAPTFTVEQYRDSTVLRNPCIVGCITYRVVGDDAPHQTTFAYMLHKGRSGEHQFRSDEDFVPMVHLGHIVVPGGHAN